MSRWQKKVAAAINGEVTMRGSDCSVFSEKKNTRVLVCSSAAAIALLVISADPANADEGGVSFWLPGLFGSLAAVPGTPGLSWSNIYIHPQVSAGKNQAFANGGQIDVGIDGTGNLVAFGPTYVLPQLVLGGRLALSLFGVAGQNVGTASAILTGPGGATLSGADTDSVAGFGDLLPQASLAWNNGVNNFMTYVTGDVPVGSYDPTRLANLGIGHGAIDGGAGYTYFNPATGHELSAVGGFTYNFENAHTDYQNGIDFHLDWAASQFLNKQVFVGAVGYLFQQLTGDTGSGAILGPFESSTVGIGPQIGYIFPVNDQYQGLFNVKGYVDLATKDRAKGWSVWVTLAFTPTVPKTKAQ
jgi:hypothetical protein